MGLQASRVRPQGGAVADFLLILLHGVGGRGEDLIALAPSLAVGLPGLALAAPTAEAPYDVMPEVGQQWFSLINFDPELAVERGARPARQALDAFIDAELAELGLPAEAYAVMGFSQGAMMALYTGLRRPTPPRAVLAYAGALIGAGPLAAEAYGRPPVLLVHGEDDDVIPASMSRAAASALRALSYPVRTVFVPGVAHVFDPVGLAAGAAMLVEVAAARG